MTDVERAEWQAYLGWRATQTRTADLPDPSGLVDDATARTLSEVLGTDLGH